MVGRMMERGTASSVAATEAWGMWAGGQPECSNFDTTGGIDCPRLVVLLDSNGTIGS